MPSPPPDGKRPGCAQGPLRIFLSYGHDENAAIVGRIQAELEKRGHDVWLDTSSIKAGQDWRRCITEGILNSDRVLCFLSKHSVRNPGVCLDEIAIALGAKGGSISTVLLEHEEEVQVPASISHIQWLDMQDWEERLRSGGPEWQGWYDRRISELIDVIEGEEGRRFAGEIRLLQERLQPTSSEARIRRLIDKGMVGRQWLLSAVNEWSASRDRASRIFWITGAPGVGKSAFAAHLAHFGRDKVIAVHFCEYDKPDHRSAHAVVRTLAFQLAARLPDYRRLLLERTEIATTEGKTSAELFDYLLAGPLSHTIGGGRQRYLAVIDALDEATEEGRNPLAELLARDAERLAGWLGIVVTSRPESEVAGPLQGLTPFCLDAAEPRNLSDIEGYARQRLSPQLEDRTPAEVSRLLSGILRRSEGVFLYAEYFCDEVERGRISLDEPDQFPNGLGGSYSQYFQRQFPDADKYRTACRPLLRMMLAARESLPLEVCQSVFDWTTEQSADAVRSLGTLFPVATESGCAAVRPFHRSLADWLADSSRAGIYFADPKEGNRMLADYCWSGFQQGAQGMTDYAWKHLAAHLQAAERWEDLLTAIRTPALGLLRRWTQQETSEDGLACIQGLIREGGAEGEDLAALETQLARILGRRGRYTEMEELLTSALSRTSYWRARKVRAVAIHELGSLHLYRGERKEAERCYGRALRLCRWGLQRYPAEASANLIALATVASRDYDWKRVVRLTRRAADLSHSCGDFAHKLAAGRLGTFALERLGHSDQAMAELEPLLALSESAGADHERMRLLVAKAWFLYRQAVLTCREVQRTRKAFAEARRSASRLMNYYGQLDCSSGLAWSALAAGEVDEAADYFGDVARLAPGGSHQEMTVGACLGLAAAAHAGGDFETAADRYRSALKSSRMHGFKGYEAMASTGLAGLLWHAGESKEAEDWFRQAMESAEANSPRTVQMTKHNIRRCRQSATQSPL